MIVVRSVAIVLGLLTVLGGGLVGVLVNTTTAPNGATCLAAVMIVGGVLVVAWGAELLPRKGRNR